MARSTTSNEQPSPPFYRGHRVTKHNHHQAVDVTQVNTQITDAVTQASAQVFVPRSSDAAQDSLQMRLVLPALSL